MVLKRFYTEIIIRIILIVFTSLLFSFVWLEKFDILLLINILAMISLQVWLLIKRLNKTNIMLSNFLDSVSMEDVTFSGEADKNFPSLHRLSQSLASISNQVKMVRLAEAERNEYFKIVVEHADIGLMIFNEEGKTDLYNKSAMQLLGIRAGKNIKNIDTIYPGFSEKLFRMIPGYQQVIKLKRGEEYLHLLIRCNQLNLRSEKVKLVSLQNIRVELDEKELESWQKLIRILTHEIMNSVGPISSSVETVQDLLGGTGIPFDNRNGKYEMSCETIQDVQKGISIIKERSEGMLSFVKKFRNLVSLPTPEFSVLKVDNLLERVLFLLENELKANEIQVKIIISPANLTFTADQGMAEQVLINLVKNAADSLKEGGRNRLITVKSFRDIYEMVVIQVIDNGHGIDEDVMDKIFIPFFTTKKEGSGIGLSLSRQMMKLNNGDLQVTSEPDVETIVTARFVAGSVHQNLAS